MPVLVDGEEVGVVEWVPKSGAVLVDGLRCAINNNDDEATAMTAVTPQIGDAWISKNVNGPSPTANVWTDMWPLSGNPDAGTYAGAAATAQAATSSTAGAMVMGLDVSPLVKQIVSAQGTSQLGNVETCLYDRVLYYPSCAFNSALVSMTNTTVAPRYIGAGDQGLQLFITLQTAANPALGGAVSLTAISYTAVPAATHAIPKTPYPLDAVTQGPDATNIASIATQTGAAAGLTSPLMPLASGDTGISAILSYTSNATVTGTVCFVLAYPLAWLTFTTANLFHALDLSKQLVDREIVKDGACPSLLYKPFTSNSNNGVNLRVVFNWG